MLDFVGIYFLFVYFRCKHAQDEILHGGVLIILFETGDNLDS